MLCYVLLHYIEEGETIKIRQCLCEGYQGLQEEVQLSIQVLISLLAYEGC